MWSHILGEAMEGPLKGKDLKIIPADMLTWAAWKKEHPKTTVLNLRRTGRAYTRAFYQDPHRFVYGFEGAGGVFHCSLGTLKKQPIINASAGGLPRLIAFDPQSTSIRLFDRRVGEQTLSFEARGPRLMRDRETGSYWRRTTGMALEGPLKGKKLTVEAGIISFAHAWKTFHPDSEEVRADDRKANNGATRKAG